jgi:hypothetical protein
LPNTLGSIQRRAQDVEVVAIEQRVG